MLRLDYNSRAMALLSSFSMADRLPHAILLEGPEGCGKKTMAKIIAQAALCNAENKPCGICSSCLKVEKEVHPDVCVFTVPPDKKDFPVELVREIRAQAYIAPNEGVCKIFILDKAHTMNSNAQNAILKLLEEPPPSLHFILLSETRSRMLTTILSRVTSIELDVPTVEQCAKILGYLLPEQDEVLIKAAAAGAAGNVGRALSLMGTAKPSRAAADARVLRDAFISGTRYTCAKVLASYDKDRDTLLQMLPLLCESFSQLAAAKYRGANEAETKLLTRVTPIQLAKAVLAIEKATQRAQSNVSVPLLCACMLEEVKMILEQ